MTLKERFRHNLDRILDRDERNELERIYGAASENADEDDEEDSETVFEMTVENERDDATGDVRRFLDDLLR
jgi:hypothetical protein